ncbi:MAG TPA: hypothetical protein PK264_14115 [Hyphomicrobiaceae bacterium]|nr:hypothetical protein [Hyphomicrobiaceae bacterium]
MASFAFADNLILIFKVTVTPLLVALASLAARRWGPRVGGILIGFPVMTGPIALFLALEQGVAFAARASVGILLALIAVAGWIVIYAWLAPRARWPLALALASVGYVLPGYWLAGLETRPAVAAALAIAAILAAIVAIGHPRGARITGPVPWWDIWLRMLVSATLVTGITLAAERLGPMASGIVGTFPAISTVVVTFTHHRWGAGAATAIMRGLLLSLLSFASCFLVIGELIISHGIAVSFLLGVLAGGVTSLAVLSADGWLRRSSES